MSTESIEDLCFTLTKIGKMNGFTREEKKQLDSFVSLVETIGNRRFFRRGLPDGKLSYRDTSEGTNKGRLDLPDEEELRSVLLDLRKVFAQSHSTNFGKICNIVRRKATDPTVVEDVEKIRESYNDSMQKSDFKIVIDGETITFAKALNLWLNGHYFHDEEEKRDRLFEKYANFEAELKFEFFVAVRTVAAFAFGLAEVVEKALTR